MRGWRKERLLLLTKVLEKGPRKGPELRKLYVSSYALDGDLTLLSSLGIVKRRGLVAFGQGTAVLERPLTREELDSLFPSRQYKESSLEEFKFGNELLELN